jgi:hypothetical protein
MFSASQDRSQFRSSIVAASPAPEQYLGIAENTVEWGSQLMAHVGQECRFRPIGRFGALFSFLELDLMFLQFSSPQLNRLL